MPLSKRTQQPRHRAFGAGRRYSHHLRDRLLRALFWLRVSPTSQGLGFFFSLDQTNAEDNSKEGLATPHAMTAFAFERPAAEREKLHSPQAVREAFPDLRLVIDAQEQRIQRPQSDKDHDRRKPSYAGKKKAHPVKNQVAVRPEGAKEAVSDRVPGGANHDLTLRRQRGLLDHLESAEAAMRDAGYDGIRNDSPEVTIDQPHQARRHPPLSEEQKAEKRHPSS